MDVHTIQWLVLIASGVLWFIGAEYWASKAAKEMALETGQPWAVHLFLNNFWKVKSERGQKLVRRTHVWAGGGMGIVLLLNLAVAIIVERR